MANADGWSFQREHQMLVAYQNLINALGSCSLRNGQGQEWVEGDEAECKWQKVIPSPLHQLQPFSADGEYIKALSVHQSLSRGGGEGGGEEATKRNARSCTWY